MQPAPLASQLAWSRIIHDPIIFIDYRKEATFGQVFYAARTLSGLVVSLLPRDTGYIPGDKGDPEPDNVNYLV